jgi:glycerophosphoryl diester phosphodiesterase
MNRTSFLVRLAVSLTALAFSYVAARVSALETERVEQPTAEVSTEVSPPLIRAHAHNDYEHRRPLLDALSRGFSSIEADVWLSRGKMLVAHQFWQTSSSRTLSSLYLKPLQTRVAQNHGTVYRGSKQSVNLLIDVKTDAEETYRALHEELSRYSNMLTTFERGEVRLGAVTAIISGDCPRAQLAKQRRRFAACDGRIEDLNRASPASLVPLISENWSAMFDWHGAGAMPSAQRAKLLRITRTAHARGQKVRFWSTPDGAESKERVAVWLELIAAGVDYINTDELDTLRRFLLRYDRPSVRTGIAAPWLGAPILSAR